MVEVSIVDNSIAGNVGVIINTGTRTMISTGSHATIAAGAGAVTNAGAAAINTNSVGTIKTTGAPAQLSLTVGGPFSVQMPVPTTEVPMSLPTSKTIVLITMVLAVAVLLTKICLNRDLSCTGFVVSLLTCIKIGAINFVFGVAVGFSLKRKLRGWAAMLLKKIMADE